MKVILKLRIIVTACLLMACCMLSSLDATAQTFNFKTIEFDSLHTADYIHNHNGFNDTIVVSHDKWDEVAGTSNNWWNSNFKFKSVHSFVRFSVDHAYPVRVFEPYTFRLTYMVYGFANPASPNSPASSFSDTLTISFNPDSLATFQDKQYKKYSNFHKIMVVFTGLYKIDGAGGVPQPVDIANSNFALLNFNVEAAIVVQPFHKNVKNPANSTYATAYGTNAALHVAHAAEINNVLPVSWTMPGFSLSNVLMLTPAKYELEWTYIDNYKVNLADGSVSAIPEPQLKYNFKDNATRVWLDTNYYQIPLIYQKGHLVYRVRLVRPDSVEYRYPVYGPWTVASQTGTVSSIASASKYQISDAHISDSLNWQYTVSFAEQGKYKHVMSYYDGMLKNRQSITRFNSLPGRLIATEQVYDYEGRPSISILPTPLASNKFCYIHGLALNANTALPYKASDFDRNPTDSICPQDVIIPPLADNSWADIYYSPNNPDKSGYQKFVPDAGGYPLVQTIYSPGYDERVEKQGGAGDTLQIGYQHNVKNDYVSTEQADLNKMFGTNIGWTGFYRKTVSRDPNGQTSLNITDYKGKTMMSSMIGLPDTSVHALVSNENLAGVTPYNEDFIAGTTQQTTGNKIILDKNFYNEAAGNNKAFYVATFKPFPAFCGKYLTVKAKYDYSIFNECGTEVAQEDGVIGNTGVITSGNPVSYTGDTVGFYMDKGKHSLHKVLTVNTDDIALAVDSFMSLPASQNCLKDEPWFIRESVLSKQFPCPGGYGNADCNPCEDKKYQMMQELYPNQDSAYVVKKYGVYKTINGVVVGNGNSDFTLLCGYGDDPSQWGVEYPSEVVANKTVVDDIGTWTNPASGVNGPGVVNVVLVNNDTLNCRYRYQNDCIVNLPDTIYKYGVAYTSLQQLPVEDFIDIFNDSIAEALLPLHPEYCELLKCVDDPYAKKLRSIPDGDIAGQLSLLKLSQMIGADPLLIAMQNSGNFPSPLDTLGFMGGGIMSLDILALSQAYCSSNLNDMTGQCQSEMFHNEIANGILINDFVRDKYFKAIRDLYLANRERYKYLLSPDLASLGGCEICDSVRMDLVPDPVFPDDIADVNNVMEDFLSGTGGGTATQVQPGSPGAAQNVVAGYFDLLNQANPYSTSPYDTLAPYSDSAVNVYTATAEAIMQTAVDSMVSQFVNCITPSGSQADFAAINAYLMNLYNTGQVLNLQFTPAQIRAALVANNVKLDDLCNPYIVNYDDMLVVPENDGSGGMNCGGLSMFADMTTFLNQESLTALQNPGTNYSISLGGGNGFEAALASQLGAASCSVVANANPSAHLYTLTYASGSQQVKLNIKTGGGAPQNPFIVNAGSAVALEVQCTKETFGGFPTGYIGNYSFAVIASHTATSGGAVTKYKLKAWNDKITLNNTGDNPIGNCVPCTQMKALYTQFWDTCNVYGMKGTSHPMYKTMLRNFMNFNLKKPFTESQYLDFVESCALADKMHIKNFVGWHANFADSAAAFTFINDLNAYTAPVNIIPSYIYRNSVGINLMGVPKNKLRLCYNFMANYCTPGNRNITYQDLKGDSYKSTVFLPVGSSFSNMYPGMFVPVYAGNYDVWNGSDFVPSWGYHLYTHEPNNYAGNGQSMDILERYEMGNATVFVKGIKHTVNAEYYLPEKQAYLTYVYNHQNLPAGKVLDTLQTQHLESSVSVFNGKVLSYGHPAQPGKVQHLYIGDPNTATANTHYQKLSYIIGQVTNQFSGSLFFTGTNAVNIPQSGSRQLTAYRCRDTAFWYRYFDDGDTLYNVFLRVPGYIDQADLSGYQVQNFTYNLGEGNSRSFKVTLHNPAAPVQNLVLNGFTDFTVARNKVLHDVLLTHAVNEGIPVADTVDNCERTLLIAAITEGKIQHKMYIDSIRNQLNSAFFAWLMNNGISENLFVSYRNQRFNYTLYNYDRAGNLVATVPPAGVSPLTPVQMATVDPARQNNNSSVPGHNKTSVYEYNTLNQVVYQNTPDGGKTDFYYDAAGRVIFSQNDKQRPLGRMTYTLYDNQGRIFETGQAKIACPWFAPIYHASANTTGPNNCYYFDAVNHIVSSLPPLVTDLLHKTNEEVVGFVQSLDREEVVYTHYDAASVNLAVKPGFAGQENLRKRVSTIKYFDFLGAADSTKQHYKYAMHFSYDISGNVKTLVRDYPAYQSINQDWKRVDYDYDVISGKVNLLSYNRGFPDQFYQKYGYDADNRITEVNTSNDGIIWQRDASYQYYQHGPLARMSLGDLRVQGVDYAYTIQGWLKAVNGDMLDPEKDMGEDAAGGGYTIHPNDAVALSLDYFNGDYKPIGDTAVMHIEPLGKNLYNGNIPRATTSILPFPDLKSQYTYDQLNRIVRADYAYMNRADATLTNTADYYSSYAYDPDGNLKKLVRNGNNPNAGQKLMDSLSYYYSGYVNYSTSNNKLVNITDHVPDANYPAISDITQYQSQYANRYTYDATGNVVQDLVSGQNNIVWNHYNKVAYDYNTQGHTMAFEYDGAGNRYLKSVNAGDNKDTTSVNNDYYVRDAQGNILAIYKDESDYVMTKEQWIEHITAQMYVRCGWWEIMDKYLLPMYGSNAVFKEKLFNYARANNYAWVQQQVTDSAVSWYLKKSKVVSNNFHWGLRSYPAVLKDMAQWSRNNSVSLIGPYLNHNLGFVNGTAHLAGGKLLLATLFTPQVVNPTSVEGGILGMLCSEAPGLMEAAMAAFGTTNAYQPGSQNCPENAEALNAALINKGYNAASIIKEIYALRNVNTAQYAGFLEQLYSGSTQFYKNGGQYTALSALCVKAPNIFSDIADTYGDGYTANCENDVEILNTYIHFNPLELKLLNEDVMNMAEEHPDEFNAFANVLWNGNISTERDTLAFGKVLTHFVMTSPKQFVKDIFRDLGITYNPYPLATIDSLRKYFFNNNANGPLMGQHIINRYRYYYNTNNSDGNHPYHINRFIDSIVNDPIIMGSNFFADGNQSQAYYGDDYGDPYAQYRGINLFNLSMSALNSYGLTRFHADKMYAFIDQWSLGRTALEGASGLNALLDAVYQNSPATFIDNYITAAGGNAEILNQSLMAMPDLTLNGFVDDLYRVHNSNAATLLPQWCLKTIVIDSIVHEVYKQAQHHRRFSLASHHLYGSSRLGTKDYLPGEFYKLYDNTGATEIADTMTLASQRPWYSLEYNDQIEGLALQPYGKTDMSSFYAGHRIGSKQYELTNHLGNVQATVSDLPHPYGESAIEGYHPALPATYDYYPFGMLMPDRYTNDTTNKCMTVTQTKWVTRWVDSCYDAPKWEWPLSETIKNASISLAMWDPNNTLASYVEMDASQVGSGISFGFSTVPGTGQQLSFDITDVVSGMAEVEAGHMINGNWFSLGRMNIRAKGVWDMSIAPIDNMVLIRILGPCKIRIRRICIKKPVQVQQTYLVDICSKMKDRYRFGFNGQEKVNEWAGIGNFMDYKERGQDTRIARFTSRDQMAPRFPMLSPYQFASNTPIQAIDLDGNEAIRYDVVEWINSDGETVTNMTTSYDVGSPRYGNEGVLITYWNTTTGITREEYTPETTIIYKKTAFDIWWKNFRFAAANDFQGKAGYDALGKHILPTFMNTFGMLIGIGEFRAAYMGAKGAWGFANITKVGISGLDLTLGADDLLKGGFDESPIESILPQNGKASLNALKAGLGAKSTIEGGVDFYKGAGGIDEEAIENVGTNAFKIYKSGNDTKDNTQKAVEQYKPKEVNVDGTIYKENE